MTTTATPDVAATNGDILRTPRPPRDPIPLEEVFELYPTLRQSLLGAFDECALRTLFELRHAQGWSTHPQARGTVFHRFAGEALRTMRAVGSRTIPRSEAIEILYEATRQRDLPVAERVRVPLRELRLLRMAVFKFAADNEFSVDKILDIERRLATTVTYDGPNGPVERVLTGQLDVLMAHERTNPHGVLEHGAVVIDWKDTWALPPQQMEVKTDEDGFPYEDDGEHVSYEGYFQQRFYALLVMHKFPGVQYVTLREFYPRKTKVREATVTRGQLHHIEQEMAVLAEAFDATVAAGARDAGTLKPRDAWRPSPGKHCAFCLKPGACPIEREAKGEGAIHNAQQARKYAAEWEVATKVRAHRWKALRAWCAVHGLVTLRGSKGRRAMGFVERYENTAKGRRLKSIFGIFTPDESDRGSDPTDERLADAMRESAEEVRQARKAAKRR